MAFLREVSERPCPCLRLLLYGGGRRYLLRCSSVQGLTKTDLTLRRHCIQMPVAWEAWPDAAPSSIDHPRDEFRCAFSSATPPFVGTPLASAAGGTFCHSCDTDARNQPEQADAAVPARPCDRRRHIVPGTADECTIRVSATSASFSRERIYACLHLVRSRDRSTCAWHQCLGPPPI